MEKITATINIYYMICMICRTINGSQYYKDNITKEYVYEYECVECGFKWQLITEGSNNIKEFTDGK